MKHITKISVPALAVDTTSTTSVLQTISEFLKDPQTTITALGNQILAKVNPTS